MRDAGDDVLALRVHQELAVEDVLAGGGIAREGDAGAGVGAHVAEHHRLDVDRRAPALGDVVQLAVGDGALVVPRAEHGADGAPELLLGVSGKTHALAHLDERLELLHQLAQVVGVSSVSSVTPRSRFFSASAISNGSLLGLRLRLQVEDDVAVHLHEAAVGVVGEALVAGLAR